MVLEKIQSPLVLKTVSVPAPTEGEVLVKVISSGLNPLDVKIRDGNAPHAQVNPPAILGVDMAGVVIETGEGINKFNIGDEVFGMVGGVGDNQGTLAEYIAVDADLLALKPQNMTMREAASLPLVLVTAWEGLVDRAKVHEGQKVLIHGGSGGIGYVAIQIAQAFGAAVYATGSGDSLNYIKELGAVPIDYTDMEHEEYLRLHTDEQGFDIVFDTVGGTTLDTCFKSVKRYTGHVVSALGWGTHSIAPLSFRGATYSGIFTLFPLLTGQERAHQGEILQQASKIIERGKLKPLLFPKVFQLEEINEAYRSMEERTTPGKLVVDVSADLN